MINTIFFGINIVLFMLVWKYMLRPSILDHYRDKLFDLREEVRSYYLSRDLSFNEKTYISLRDLLNSHLRFTEKMSLTKISYFSSKIDRNNELSKHIKDEINAKFETNDEHLASFIKVTRTKSIKILLNYMILSSPILILLLIFISCVYLPIWIGKLVLSSIQRELNYLSEAMLETSKIVTKYIATKDELEEFSYEASSIEQLASIA